MCKQVLLSLHRHDFRQCGCPNETFTDGGTWYLHRGAKDITQIKDLSIYLVGGILRQAEDITVEEVFPPMGKD